jgi:hypothetical protein
MKKIENIKTEVTFENLKNPFLYFCGIMILWVALKSESVLAAGGQLDSALAGVKGEVNNLAGTATGIAASAGFGLMGLGAGNLGKTVAITGIGGSIGYMVWPAVERKLKMYTGTGH